MEKTDLLVHIQKIQLELDLEKNKTNHGSLDAEALQKDIERLKHELTEKDLECKKWISKIEQANDLANDLTRKNHLIDSLHRDLESEKNKRGRAEEMLQGLAEREKKWTSTKQIDVSSTKGYFP